MRFLKTKILLAKEASEKKLLGKVSTSLFLLSSPEANLDNNSQVTTEVHTPSSAPLSPLDKSRQRKRAPKQKSTSQSCDTKNITINYSKAIISFATSYLASPYLKPLLDKENLQVSEFNDFILGAKQNIGGISSFKRLLLAHPGDSPRETLFKKIFTFISEIFIKYFSVNWIMHGKVTHKITYLKYRFKMLRRIQNPEDFTYIRERKKKASN